MDLDSTEAIKSVVEAGLGIGNVSRWAISKELELRALKVVEVDGINVARHFSIALCAGPEPLDTVAAFRTFSLEQCPASLQQYVKGSPFRQFEPIKESNRPLELLFGY